MSSPSRKYIVGLVGYKQSGKDTLCKIIQKWFPQAVRLAFADPLKIEVYDALSCEGPPEDTKAVLRIANEHGLDLRGIWPPKDRSDQFKTAYIESQKGTLRPILQKFGTEYRRSSDHYYWIRQTDNAVREADTNLVVITDVRFPNEGDYVHGNGGFLVRVDRDGGVSDGHTSEDYPSVCRPEVVVTNPGTTVEEFESSANYLRLHIQSRLDARE